MCGSRTGFELTVADSQGDELLKAGIDLLVHGRVLGSDVSQLLKQARAAVVVVALRILEPLPMLGSVGLNAGSLGRSGLGALHSRGTAYGLGDPPLAHAGTVLFLACGDRATGSCGFRGAGLIRGSVVVDTLHVVKKVPATGESKSRDGSVASFKEAEMRVVSVTVESMGFTLVAEQASIRREMQVLGRTCCNFTPIGFQVGVQVFTVDR